MIVSLPKDSAEFEAIGKQLWLPKVHFVNSEGDHEEAYLRRETPDGARLFIPYEIQVGIDGEVGVEYIPVMGVERDESEKRVGTWHMPEEVEG